MMLPEDDGLDHRLYERRIVVSRKMMINLPNIPGKIELWFLSKMKKDPLLVDMEPFVGVFGLSKTEVKKDVREMERSMPDDTDSDSSVRSEDVLPSSYPVKPRKTPKVLARDKSPSRNYHHDEAGEHEYDYRTIEETLCFIDAIKKSKKDLFNAECERERLESLQNVRESCFLL
jgi:hypothetical protein